MAPLRSLLAILLAAMLPLTSLADARRTAAAKPPQPSSVDAFQPEAVVPALETFRAAFHRKSRSAVIKQRRSFRDTGLARHASRSTEFVKRNYRRVGWPIWIGYVLFAAHDVVEKAPLRNFIVSQLPAVGLVAGAGVAMAFLIWLARRWLGDHNVMVRSLAVVPVVLLMLSQGVFAMGTPTLSLHSINPTFWQDAGFGFLSIFLGNLGSDVMSNLVAKPEKRKPMGYSFWSRALGEATWKTGMRLPAIFFTFALYLPAMGRLFTTHIFGPALPFHRIPYDLSIGTMFMTSPVSQVFTLLYAEGRPLKTFHRDYVKNWWKSTPGNVLFWTLVYAPALYLHGTWPDVVNDKVVRDIVMTVGPVWSVFGTYITRHLDDAKSEKNASSGITRVKRWVDLHFPLASSDFQQLGLHRLGSAA